MRQRMEILVGACVAASLLAFTGHAIAQDVQAAGDDNAANNPLTPKITINLQDY